MVNGYQLSFTVYRTCSFSPSAAERPTGVLEVPLPVAARAKFANAAWHAEAYLLRQRRKRVVLPEEQSTSSLWGFLRPLATSKHSNSRPSWMLHDVIKSFRARQFAIKVQHTLCASWVLLRRWPINSSNDKCIYTTSRNIWHIQLMFWTPGIVWYLRQDTVWPWGQPQANRGWNPSWTSKKSF